MIASPVRLLESPSSTNRFIRIKNFALSPFRSRDVSKQKSSSKLHESSRRGEHVYIHLSLDFSPLSLLGSFCRYANQSMATTPPSSQEQKEAAPATPTTTTKTTTEDIEALLLNVQLNDNESMPPSENPPIHDTEQEEGISFFDSQKAYTAAEMSLRIAFERRTALSGYEAAITSNDDSVKSPMVSGKSPIPSLHPSMHSLSNSVLLLLSTGRSAHPLRTYTTSMGEVCRVWDDAIAEAIGRTCSKSLQGNRCTRVECPYLHVCHEWVSRLDSVSLPFLFTAFFFLILGNILLGCSLTNSFP